MFPSKNKKNTGRSLTRVNWYDHAFYAKSILDIHSDIENKLPSGLVVLTGKDRETGDWIPYYVGFMPNSFDSEVLTEAKKLGATHIHILPIESNLDEKIINEYKILHLNLIGNYQPALNKQDKFNSTGPLIVNTDNSIGKDQNESNELHELKVKLELLYSYQGHYLQLIKDYKEEIKFASTLQEDLRRERSQFFTQTLKEVLQTLHSAEVEKNVSNKWIEELVTTYTKSLDLSSDLAKTHVVDILGILTNEAKLAATSGQLDKIRPNSDVKNDE